MTDNEIFTLLIARLNVLGFPVIQKNQPNLEGATTGSAIYFEKLFDKSNGFPMMEETYIAPVLTPPVVSGGFREREYTNYETTLQISAFALQDVNNTSAPTASDIVLAACGLLQARALVRLWQPIGLGILRVTTPITNPYFTNDKQQYEASPSFDLIVTHKRYNDEMVGEITQVKETGLFPI